jgi:alpha-L-arabinofuranosidase
MLDDHKLFFDVNSKPDNQPAPPRRLKPNRWRPSGADGFVVMDRVRPYVGDHTPLLRLEGQIAHGIQQAGLELRQGKAYAGRVVLAGGPFSKGSVALVWGPKSTDRQRSKSDSVDSPTGRHYPA